MQESTIKSNFTHMRLLCGLLLFSITDCCLIVAGICNVVFHFLVGVTQFSALTLALQLLFHILRNYFFSFVQSDTNKTFTFSVDIPKLFFIQQLGS